MFTTKQIRACFVIVFLLILVFPSYSHASWGFTWLYDFVNSFWQALYDTVVWFGDGIVFCVQAVIYWILDIFFTIIIALLGTLDFSALVTNITLSWAGVPTQLIYLINQCYIPQGLTILGSSYLIRLILNLIPSWITRV